jgi:hypothetical protein
MGSSDGTKNGTVCECGCSKDCDTAAAVTRAELDVSRSISTYMMRNCHLLARNSTDDGHQGLTLVHF